MSLRLAAGKMLCTPHAAASKLIRVKASHAIRADHPRHEWETRHEIDLAAH
jgi:hypothetical protein